MTEKLTRALKSKTIKCFRGLAPSVLLVFTCSSVQAATLKNPSLLASTLDSGKPMHDLASKAPATLEVLKPLAPAIEGGVFTISVQKPSSEFRDLKAVKGYFQNREVLFFPDRVEPGIERYTAVVGVEYGTEPGDAEMDLVFVSSSGEKQERVTVTVKAGNFSSEKLRVPPRTIDLSAKDQKRIEKEVKFLNEVYSRKTLTKLWDSAPIMPVNSQVTSEFGTFRVYNGKKLNPHLGTDLRAPKGERIVAPVGGKVVLARDLFYTGYTVILDHGYGMFTVYGHLSKLSVREGGAVTKGNVIGLSGSTGRATGPHLHWGAKVHGTRVDPISLMRILRQ